MRIAKHKHKTPPIIPPIRAPFKEFVEDVIKELLSLPILDVVGVGVCMVGIGWVGVGIGEGWVVDVGAGVWTGVGSEVGSEVVGVGVDFGDGAGVDFGVGEGIVTGVGGVGIGV